MFHSSNSSSIKVGRSKYDLVAQDHRKNTKFEWTWEIERWTWPKSTWTWWTLHHCWLGASTNDSQASSTLRWSCTRRKASSPRLSPQCTLFLVQLMPPSSISIELGLERSQWMGTSCSSPPRQGQVHLGYRLHGLGLDPGDLSGVRKVHNTPRVGLIL